MNEYSIATFLEALADDDLEKEMIELVAKGIEGEELLKQLLAKIGKKK